MSRPDQFPIGDPNRQEIPVLISTVHRAMAGYIDDLGTVMREAAVDYHRVNLSDPIDEVLARFLLRRRPKKGAK